MATLEKIPGKKTRNTLPWVLAGGVFAPILIVSLSLMNADPSMRVFPILLFVTLVGALAGRLVYTINERSKAGKWWRSTAAAVGFLVYILLVFISFFVARMGPL